MKIGQLKHFLFVYFQLITFCITAYGMKYYSNWFFLAGLIVVILNSVFYFDKVFAK
jgi:hypothetical protein